MAVQPSERQRLERLRYNYTRLLPVNYSGLRQLPTRFCRPSGLQLGRLRQRRNKLAMHKDDVQGLDADASLLRQRLQSALGRRWRRERQQTG